MDTCDAQINHAARQVTPALSWMDALSPGPQLVSTLQDGRLELAAAGSWTARHADALERLIDEAVAQSPRRAQLLSTWRACMSSTPLAPGCWSGCAHWTSAWRDRDSGPARPLSRPVEEVRRANRTPAQCRRRRTESSGLEGSAAERWGRPRSRRVPRDAGRDRRCPVGALRQPRTLRLTSAVHHLDRVGWQAVPIILLITFLIGCIIAQQGFFHFRKFGADDYVVDMVGILVLREIGVLIVADHGGRPLGQLLHRRARLDEDARGDRRAAHHGVRSGRGADPAARARAGHRAADPGVPRLDGGALWRRAGGLALWRNEPGRSSSPACGRRSRSRISRSA